MSPSCDRGHDGVCGAHLPVWASLPRVATRPMGVRVSTFLPTTATAITNITDTANGKVLVPGLGRPRSRRTGALLLVHAGDLLEPRDCRHSVVLPSVFVFNGCPARVGRELCVSAVGGVSFDKHRSCSQPASLNRFPPVGTSFGRGRSHPPRSCQTSNRVASCGAPPRTRRQATRRIGELEKRAQRIVDRIGISECLCHIGIEYHDVRALRCQPLGVLSSDGLGIVEMVLGA